MTMEGKDFLQMFNSVVLKRNLISGHILKHTWVLTPHLHLGYFDL